MCDKIYIELENYLIVGHSFVQIYFAVEAMLFNENWYKQLRKNGPVKHLEQQVWQQYQGANEKSFSQTKFLTTVLWCVNNTTEKNC